MKGSSQTPDSINDDNSSQEDKDKTNMDSSGVDDLLPCMYSTEIHSQYTRVRHISSNAAISVPPDPIEEEIGLFDLEQSFNSLFFLPTRRSSTSEGIVTQQSWTRMAQSPAVSFLSRFSPSEELLNSWSCLFDDDMNIRENSILKDKYVIGKIIGQGAITESREGFPIVSSGFPDPIVLKIAKFLPGTESANKICRLFTREISIWKTLEHPNVLPLLDLLTCPGMIVAVSPMAINGDLLKLSQKASTPFSISTIRNIMKQVANALYYLHIEKSVIHKDIKLENILVHSRDHVYICDFGLSESLKPFPINKDILVNFGSDQNQCSITSLVNGKWFTDFKCNCPCLKCKLFKPSSLISDDQLDSFNPQQLQSFCTGSLWYCPPEELVPELKLEIINCECEKIYNGPKADIWAFGVCLYALVKGKFPFMDEFIPRLQKKVQSGVFEHISVFSGIEEDELDELNELVCNSLMVNRNERWDIKQVMACNFFKHLQS